VDTGIILTAGLRISQESPAGRRGRKMDEKKRWG
jgi:hypothetical protein